MRAQKCWRCQKFQKRGTLIPFRNLRYVEKGLMVCLQCAAVLRGYPRVWREEKR
jgi:hypothetical protein